MGWYAVEEIDEAVDRTRELLLPFDWKVWPRLLLLVLLTGGVSSPGLPSGSPDTADHGSSYGQSYSDSPLTTQFQQPMPRVPGNMMTGMAAAPNLSNAALASIAILLAFLVVFFLFLDSVFEFVYYQSLLDEEVRIRENFRKHFRNGVRYFGFRAGIWLILLLLAGVTALISSASPMIGVLFLLAGLLFLIPFLIFMGLVHNFVLLKMIETGDGVLRSLRSFFVDLKGQWDEVAVYVVIRLVLKIGAGVLGLLWGLTVFIVLIIPFGVIGLLLYLVWPPLAVLPAAAFILIGLVAVLAIQVPIQTYLYYYAILVYHDLTSSHEAEAHRGVEDPEEDSL